MTTDEKYLINPFIKEVNSKSFINRKYTMNIIQGTTGLGKTYATYNTFVPYCFETTFFLSDKKRKGML